MQEQRRSPQAGSCDDNELRAASLWPGSLLMLQPLGFQPARLSGGGGRLRRPGQNRRQVC